MEKQAFHQYLDDHPELVEKDAFPVFMVYNFKLSEEAAKAKFKEEIEEYVMEKGSTPVLDSIMKTFEEPSLFDEKKKK